MKYLRRFLDFFYMHKFEFKILAIPVESDKYGAPKSFSLSLQFFRPLSPRERAIKRILLGKGMSKEEALCSYEPLHELPEGFVRTK